MVNLTGTEMDAALMRGKMARTNEPRATSARYDAKRRQVVVHLSSGCSFSFPPQLVQGLEQADHAQLASVEILGAGYGLHWEALDVDISVPGLLSGLFGTAAYIARRAGATVSPAKAAAARTNGAKGGRPRKAVVS